MYPTNGYPELRHNAHYFFVGVSLLAMAVGQSMGMLGLMASSPASRLLQGSWVYV
jgi:hypothetical protein